MKILLQRVQSANVTVSGEMIGEIEKGLVAFVGIEANDNLAKGQKLIDKLVNYRVFPDETNRMNESVMTINGAVLFISQFTLAANTNAGLRPSFSSAMPPTDAQTIYEQLCDYLSSQVNCAFGQFGSDMQVHLINDGPVTFLLESK